ncbi:hypothetical protein L1987_01649 [Smallanthus sonchifolius]|uniref:Uncharacterized protein n=1 Tax=Smallanthus sonchifolius TaxID=185202 RepID=A0ACB9K5M1_9ASTR|nr:hypothetical protein L1987_01649 [Smallanthus sonchifolius]
MEVDFNALGAIQMCLPKTTKELWEALEKMFAGSEEVKENRRDILKQQYENFVRKEVESLTILYNRFTYLVGLYRVAGHFTQCPSEELRI